jgi:glycosyltransferase involved in cell wall biosynthesis
MKYSILVPAYKSKFFRECIDSILGQTYTDFELVILNDCSPEPIKDIVYEYNDKRIRYFENEKNVGAVNVVDNWNKLLALSQGEYIICMGDDDKLGGDCLDTYSLLMNRYPNYDLYHARTAIIDENSEIFNLQDDRPDCESVYSMLWHSRVNFIGDYLFKKEALILKGGFYKLPLALASDWITALLVAGQKGVVNCHRPVFYYRTSSCTITSSGDFRLQAEANLQWQSWIETFLENIPSDSMDIIYRKLMLLRYKKNFSASRSDFFVRDLNRSFVNSLIYWLKHKKHYGLSWSLFFKSILKHFFYSCFSFFSMFK